MAFADSGIRSVIWGSKEAEVTLAAACVAGDLLGSSGATWILADASTSVPAKFVAMVGGAIGAEVPVTTKATVNGITGATAGDPVYMGESGAYAASGGTFSQVVGTIVSATELSISISAAGTIGTDQIAAGAILNADVNAAAAIAITKLAVIGQHKVIAGVGATGIQTACAVAGDLTMTAAGTDATFAVAGDSIINADVKTDAAIAITKLAVIGQHKVIAGVGATGVQTACAVAGDLTMTAAGTDATFAIVADSIVNADINSAAAIACTKLGALTTHKILAGVGSAATVCAVAGDLTMTAAGTDATFAIAADTIVNADVNSAAAIVGSKMATKARMRFARTQEYDIDVIGAATWDVVLIASSVAITVTRAEIVYDVETSGTVAAGGVKIGTTAGGEQIVASTALENTKAVGYIKACTLAGSGAVPAGTPVFVRVTGVAAAAAGWVHVEIEFTVDD